MANQQHFLLLKLLFVLIFCSTTFAFVFQKPHNVDIITHGRNPGAWPLCAAKKKGGGGKKKQNKGNKKQSGMDWARSFTLKPFEAKAKRELAVSLITSFEQRTGKPLAEDLKGVTDVPRALWNAPIACMVVADSLSLAPSEEEPAAEGGRTVVTYANVAALETLGLQPDEFEKLLGSDDGSTPRDDLMDLKLPTSINGNKKFQSGYTKKIKKGREQEGDITIVDSQRWAIEKPVVIDNKLASQPVGMAYAWTEWMLGESVLCSPGGARKAAPSPSSAAEPSEPLSAEALEEAVHAQAAAVRELKEGRGLVNTDPEVVAAVQELLRLKALLADADRFLHADS